jgi:hypothetical protein
MKSRIGKSMFLFVLERNPQAENGLFGLLRAFCGKIPVSASWPKRAGYGQKKYGRIFA